MEDVLQTLSDRALLTPLAIALWFTGLLGLERWRPLRARKRGFGRRLVVNIAITASAVAVAAVTVAPVVQAMLDWTRDAGFGLTRWLGLSAPLTWAAGFLLLDLTFYYWHRANHELRWLWRFHNVHHVDPDLDVTTAFRFHAGEIALSAGFRAVQLALLGVPAAVFVAYELVFQLNTVLHHSNVRLGLGLERVLNAVLVTPRMHGIHHSTYRCETNRNYSVVFSWWDRLHRTLRLNVPQSEVTIGVPSYLEPRDNRVGALLLMPFRRQRAYWRTEEGQSLDHRAFPPPNRLAR